MPKLTKEEYRLYQKERGYKAYEKWYEKQAKAVQRRFRKAGLDASVDPEKNPTYYMKQRKLDFEQWEQVSAEIRADFKREIAEGTRKGDKGLGNINQYIARGQTYDVSYKAALAVKRAMRDKELQWGEEAGSLSIMEIMLRTPAAKEQVFDVLDEVYNAMREEGLSSYEAQDEIAILYFDSPREKREKMRAERLGRK